MTTNWADKKQVIAAVSPYGEGSEKVDPTLLADSDVVLAIIKGKLRNTPRRTFYSEWLDYADASLWKNQAFITDILKICGYQNYDKLFARVEPELWNQKDFVLGLLKETGCGCAEELSPYIPESLKKDKEFVRAGLAILNNDRTTFRHLADDSLREDEDFVFELVSDKKIDLYPLDTLRDNKKIVLEAIAQGCWTELNDASQRLQDDEEVVRAAMAKDMYSFSKASERIRAKPEFFLPAIRKNHKLAEYAIITPDLEQQLLGVWHGAQPEKTVAVKTVVRDNDMSASRGDRQK